MMEGWRKTKIEDVAFVGDGAHASIKRKETGVMYFTSKNFDSNGLKLNKVDYISEEDFKKYFNPNSKALTKPKKNDVLLSIIGSMGAPYLVNGDFEFGLSSSVSILRPKHEVVDSKYLFYWIKSEYFQKSIDSIKSGVAQSFLSLGMIRSLPCIIPPLKTQRKIAAILSGYDDLIENNLKRIKLLEEQAQQTYEEWFVRFKFPGYEDVGIDAISGLPVGWEIARLDKFTSFKYGKMPKKKMLIETGFPVYSGYRVTGYCNDYLFENPTLIIVARSVGGTGDVKIAPAKCWLTNLSIAVLVNDNIKQSYLYFHLKDSNLRSLDSGAAQSQITITSLEPYSIKVPNIELQERFDIYYTKISTMVLNLQKQNQHLKEARDILLPRLMSGMKDPLAGSGQVVDGLGMVAEEREKYKID